MALPGFSLEGNMKEISSGTLAMANLLSGDSKPFDVPALDIFKSNFIRTSSLDWIPHNYKVFIPLKTGTNVSSPDNKVSVLNFLNVSPGITTNLRINTGDVVSTEVSGHRNRSGSAFIGSILARAGADEGELVLTSNINIRRDSDHIDRNILVTKKNHASYSPATGRFTFGNDIRFAFSNGDQITDVRIKNYSPIRNAQNRSLQISLDNSPNYIMAFNADTPTIYPLEIFDQAVDPTTNQISFRLKRASAINNTPVLFQVGSQNSPQKLTFKAGEVINFTRTNPVSQADFLSTVPPVLNLAAGINDLALANSEDVNVTSVSGDADHIFPAFENPSTATYGEENVYGDQAEGGYDDSTYTRFRSVIDRIKGNVEDVKVLLSSRIDTSKNYLNQTVNEFLIDGVIKVQDPDTLNSPNGVIGYTNSPFGLAPATYIQEIGNYTRAFSTFDGPWESVVDTSGNAATGVIRTNSPNTRTTDPTFTKDMVVDTLAFKNSMIIEKFSSPTSIESTSNINVNDTTNGFDYKMPIVVEEIDPDTGEKIEVDYFLLLKSE